MSNLKKPLIGISATQLIDSSGDLAGYKRYCVNEDYIYSIINSEGNPIILPIVEDDKLLEEQAKTINGLVISGGFDINPLEWGEEPIEQLGDLCPRRDCYEKKLIEYTLKHNKPIMGICRGMQLINVFFGGTLYQDLSKIPTELKHNQRKNPEMETHNIHINKDSFLYEIVEEEKIQVNSFHHMAIKELAENLTVSAVAKDGVIEAFEKIDQSNFIIGLQFHPEALRNKHVKSMFDALITKAASS